MRKILILCTGLFLGAVATVVVLGQLPGLMRDSDVTRLALSEARIANIPAEFKRRVPAFDAVFQEFGECMQQKDCDYSPILVRRNQIIKKHWPDVFTKLEVYDDWGARFDSRHARDNFFKELDAKGRSTMLEKCLPVIEFRFVGGKPTYNFRGFECGKTAAGRTAGGFFIFESLHTEL